MNPKIIEMLRCVGVPAHVKGYTYLKDALDLCWNDKSYIEAITKRLYPDIAGREKTTSRRVERAIRHAIEIAYYRSDAETYNRIFGYSSASGRKQPTNSEFIATLTEQLNIEYGEIQTVEGR